ncbi:DUF484 family protein [Salinisphaera orenii]|uniref:Phytochrome sensor protein n=1 Tax=Salinisphaera orenii YIM 95161 TaxID=1051139 RepID=A0A423PRL3_9GAMM|nr:DUF484 family protein [Salinisphaera halophila]ROO28256.1 hypothetical protein SAHL_10430 [Salinisphaera halophila YIM 95161]
MNEAEKQTSTPQLDEAEIAAYLQAHPDFFDRYPAALEALHVAHDSGNAVSLIERQVGVLRTHNRQLQSRFNELIETARANEQRVVQMNRLAKVLVEAEDAATMVRELDYCMQQHLDVDHIYIGLEGTTAHADGEIHALGSDAEADRALTNVFRRGKPICGPLSADQSEALFATDSHDVPALASAAMIPLGSRGVHGALVLASRRPQRFVPEVGTLFLELMGELVTASLQRLLGPDVLP